jgi:hypothetical protein
LTTDADGVRRQGTGPFIPIRVLRGRGGAPMTMFSGTKRLAIVGLAVSAALAAAPRVAAAPAAGAATSSGACYYLSLGDSLAQGHQPIGGPWSPLGFPGYNQGYADQLLKLVHDRYEQLRLVKLGCGGETTTTMIVGSPGAARGPSRADHSSQRRRRSCRPTAVRWRSSRSISAATT